MQGTENIFTAAMSMVMIITKNAGDCRHVDPIQRE